ncbi:DUF2312 domain-containing protein [Ochrobactrum sp. C6C9]|nr:DUF2312 domain-containing protein [Ochrobactrum sp. C6C9]
MTAASDNYDPWTAQSAKPAERSKKAAAKAETPHDPDTGEIRDEAHSGDEITSSANTIAVAQLRAFIERIERLEEEKKTVGEDIKEVYAEAKASGFDPKTMRRIIKLRTMDDTTRHEAETMLQLYMDALGMDGGSIV